MNTQKSYIYNFFWSVPNINKITKYNVLLVRMKFIYILFNFLTKHMQQNRHVRERKPPLDFAFPERENRNKSYTKP